MVTDQIADLFTRIRNAAKAQKKTVTIPASNVKKELTRVLFENHFITKYAFVENGVFSEIKILLKYDRDMNNAIQGIKRMSSPGRRQYVEADSVPRVRNGMGIALISTSKGVLTDRECRKMNVGGELMGMVW